MCGIEANTNSVVQLEEKLEVAYYYIVGIGRKPMFELRSCRVIMNLELSYHP